ncbi:hypothetical protein NB16F76_42360 [Escherichia coli]
MALRPGSPTASKFLSNDSSNPRTGLYAGFFYANFLTFPLMLEVHVYAA